MIMIPPPPWKTATTPTFVVVVVVTAALAAGFVYVMGWIFSDASRPVSEAEKERFWRHMEKVQSQRAAGWSGQAGQRPAASAKDGR